MAGLELCGGFASPSPVGGFASVCVLDLQFYGTLDVGFYKQSKIGLRGSHDISAGNQMFFELEEDIDIATSHRTRDRGVRVIGIGG